MTRTITLPIKCSTAKRLYKIVSNCYYNTLDIIGASIIVIAPWVGLSEILYYAYDFGAVMSWWSKWWIAGTTQLDLHPVYPSITPIGGIIGITSCVCIPAFVVYVSIYFPEIKCIKDTEEP